MTQHRRLSFRALTLVLLILMLAAVGAYFAMRPKYVATATIRVHDVQPLVQTQTSRNQLPSGPAGGPQLATEACAELLRSQTNLLQALRTDKVKSLQVIQDCEDPARFLRKKLEVTIRTPDVIELAIPCKQKEGEEYRIIVSAIADAFVVATNRQERQLAADRLKKLKAVRDDLTERLQRVSADLETLADTLGVTLSADTQSAEVNPLLVRRSERMLDALAGEIARIKVAMIVDGNYERESRTETLKQLNEEYDRQTHELVQVLESPESQNPRPRRSFLVDLKKRELGRLQKHVELVTDQIFQTEVDLEMLPRFELISSGTLTEL